MARLLEGIFVLGCSVVGLGLNALEGSAVPDTIQSSVQLVNREMTTTLKRADRLRIRPGKCIELLIMKHVL